MKKEYEVRVFEVDGIDDDYQELVWSEKYEDHSEANNQYWLEIDKIKDGVGVELVEYDLDEKGEQHNWEGLKGQFLYVKKETNNE